MKTFRTIAVALAVLFAGIGLAPRRSSRESSAPICSSMI